MKRQRRSKLDMQHMKNDIRFYLLENSLDPHKAYDAMVKEHLISGSMIPYYIKGIKDFLIVADELKIELGRTEKAAEQRNDKLSTIEKLQQITIEKYCAEVKPLLKQTDNKDIKISIVNLWAYLQEGSFKGITEQELRHYKELNIV